MSNSHIFPIVFATDQDYVPILEVAVHSLACNARTPNILYKIYVLSQGLSEYSRQKIARQVLINRQVQIEFIDIDSVEQFQFNLRPNSHITTTSYLRLFIPQIFKQYDRILYIDCDTAISMDVYKFREYDQVSKDYIVCAVADGKALGDCAQNRNYPPELIEKEAAGEPVDKTSYFGKEYLEQFLQLSSYTKYINSGVIYFNLEKIHQLQIETKFIDAYEQLSSQHVLLADDQDVINYVCGQYGGVYYLDRRFNDVYWNYELALLYEKDINVAQTLLDQSVCVQTFQKSLDKWDQIFTHEKFDCIHHFRTVPKPWDTFNWLYSIFWWAATSTMENYADYVLTFHRKYGVIIDHQSLTYLNHLGDRFFSTKGLTPYSLEDLELN